MITASHCSPAVVVLKSGLRRRMSPCHTPILYQTFDRQDSVWMTMIGSIPGRLKVTLHPSHPTLCPATDGTRSSSRRRLWIVCSIIAVLFTMAAGFNGASFLNYGEDFSSLFMSLGFAIALVTLLVGLYLDRSPKRSVLSRGGATTRLVPASSPPVSHEASASCQRSWLAPSVLTVRGTSLPVAQD